MLFGLNKFHQKPTSSIFFKCINTVRHFGMCDQLLLQGSLSLLVLKGPSVQVWVLLDLKVAVIIMFVITACFPTGGVAHFQKENKRKIANGSSSLLAAIAGATIIITEKPV